MKLQVTYDEKVLESNDLLVVGAFKKENGVTLAWSDKELTGIFEGINDFKTFKANESEVKSFIQPTGSRVMVVGLGEKKSLKGEQLRKLVAKSFRQYENGNYAKVVYDLESFKSGSKTDELVKVTAEALLLSAYDFTKYKSEPAERALKEITLFTKDKKAKSAHNKALNFVKNSVESINVCRDFINEPPNVLNSVHYAKLVEKDVRTALKGKGVKVKILGRPELKKEGMNLFLSVNNGSAYNAQMVMLSYTPKKVTKNTQHVALVGKGLTFDTGGYSLKPPKSMIGMKFDMGGSATVYGAFRSAVLNGSSKKLTCILGMTDNNVNSKATTPDSIVKGRSGKTVEILNTDAEGRLVLADCLDYASDLKPDVILDAATLTGACLVALGSQVGAILGNDDKLISELKKHAEKEGENVWQLPIIPEWRDEMKSKIADLRNIGTSGFAGTATAAAFLENFVGKGISWAHFDVAGVASDQAHLPYCRPKGGSGVLVRTLASYLA